MIRLVEDHFPSHQVDRKSKKADLYKIAILVLSFQLLLMADAAHGAEISGQILAQDVLEEIEKGEPVNFEHVTIIGDLNLSQLKLPKDEKGKNLLTVPLQIKYSIFQGEVTFSDSVFSQAVDFTGTIFQRDAVFTKAKFKESVNFEGVGVNEDARFDEATFEGDSRFNKAKFNGGSSFYGALFYGDCGFYEVKFGGDSNFNKAAFLGAANFDGATFQSVANFVSAEFGGDASFYQTAFRWNTNFGDVKSSKLTYFKGAVFGRRASFEGAQLGRYVSFEDAKFNEDAEFSDAQLGDCYFWGASFGNRFLLSNTQFSIMQIDWNAIKSHLVYNEATYLSLIRNFEILGYYRNADDCYYTYRKEKQAREPVLGTKILDISAWLSCGYGVRPSYTFAISLLVTLLFGLIFWVTNASPEHKGPNTNASFPNKNARISLTDAIYFSALAFVTPHESAHWRSIGKWRYVVLFEHILGWLLMALFLVTLGKVMIR